MHGVIYDTSSARSYRNREKPRRSWVISKQRHEPRTVDPLDDTLAVPTTAFSKVRYPSNASYWSETRVKITKGRRFIPSRWKHFCEPIFRAQRRATVRVSTALQCRSCHSKGSSADKCIDGRTCQCACAPGRPAWEESSDCIRKNLLSFPVYPICKTAFGISQIPGEYTNKDLRTRVSSCSAVETVPRLLLHLLPG